MRNSQSFGDGDRSRRGIVSMMGFGLLLTTIAAPGCAGGPIAVDFDTGTVTLTLSEDPPQLDSTRTTDAVSGQVLGHAMEGLLRYNEHNQLVGGVAERWTVSDDGLTVTFHLRQEAKWSDGSPVTASDFLFAWRTVLNPNVDARYAFLLYDIQDAQAVRAGEKDFEALGVSAPDDRTLVVTLNQPAPRFPALMAFFTYLPVKQAFYEAAGDRYAADAESLLYNGPFVITHWEHDVALRLERNPHYWDREIAAGGQTPGRRSVERIHYDYFTSSGDVAFNLYDNGNVAMAGLTADTLDEALRRRWDVQQVDDGTLFYLEFNHREERHTHNLNLRKAIQFATDPDEFVNDVIRLPGNRPGASLFPAWLRGVRGTFRQEYPPPAHATDFDRARESLDAALEELGIAEASALELQLLGGDSPIGRLQAEYLQETFRRELGLDVRIDAQNFGQRLAKMRAGDFDMVLAGWGPDYDDPLTFGDLFHSMNANNYGQYDNPEYDARVQTAQTELNPEIRMEAFNELQQIVYDDVVIVPHFERSLIYVQHPRLEGVVRRVVGTSPDYRDAWLARNDESTGGD